MSSRAREVEEVAGGAGMWAAGRAAHLMAMEAQNERIIVFLEGRRRRSRGMAGKPQPARLAERQGQNWRGK